VTEGPQGNNERLAFVYDTARLRPSGPACELVVAAAKKGLSTGAMATQFARTPYAVSFARDSTRFTLITLHVAYGKPAARLPELKEIALWLQRWAGGKEPGAATSSLSATSTSTGPATPCTKRSRRALDGARRAEPGATDHLR